MVLLPRSGAMLKNTSYTYKGRVYDFNSSGACTNPTGADKAERELELFYEYYQQEVGDSNASTMLVDLTHDGTDELIILNFGSQTIPEFKELDMGARLQMLDVIDNQVTVIHKDFFSIDTPMGYRWYCIYEEEGKAYVYRFRDSIHQGGGDYEYEIYSFDESGQKKRYIYNTTFVHTGTLPVLGFDIEAEMEKAKEIAEEAVVYEKASVPLIRTGERLFREIFVEEGDTNERDIYEGNDLLERIQEK